MISIYFDTEFAGLFKNAPIISIGLINEKTGSIFYSEFSDTYESTQCSDFCKKTVLPLLDKKFSHPVSQVKIELKSWLEKQKDKEGVVLLCDAQNDIEQYRALFPQGIDGVECRKLGWWFALKRKIMIKKIYQEQKLRHHHSLDDAIANKMVALKRFFI